MGRAWTFVTYSPAANTRVDSALNHLSGFLGRGKANRLSYRLLSHILTVVQLMAAAALFPIAQAQTTTGWKVVGWNNLGMHCMDADFSVFSILPPYNTIFAQVIDPSGNLVTDPTGLTVTYEAVADASGSINRTSVGKGNFWDYAHSIFGVNLAPDVGLPVPGPSGYAMPGPNNVPQTMDYEASSEWFSAYGIPITPYDDAKNKNTYPMMRLTVRRGTTLLATTDIVLPVSDEMDCRVCHASGSSPAAQPRAGWVNGSDPQLDYRLNILRRHDDSRLGATPYQNALSVAGYSSLGLYDTVTGANPKPILCASCHLSEALPGTGQPGISPLTAAVHRGHAGVVDPINNLTLESSANRASCYRCHPGSETKCLRGVMGRSVAADGSMAMQCQSCHGSMSVVGATTRTGWLDEPNCQSCHTGTATSNNGQIRYTSVFDAPGHMRQAVNQTFATNPDVPDAGHSLFRFSRGHGGLYCEACHGSTHAEFTASEPNDNVTSIQHQGHAGVLAECTACHAAMPNTINGGPHGMHPIGQAWVSGHQNSGGRAQCQVCHGTDYRGTVLSRVRGDRTLNTEFGTKVFWQGFQIGCYNCHNGPGSESANPNHPAVVSNTTANTIVNTSVNIPLTAADADGNSLTLRIVSQATHGTVGLSGTTAAYFPDANYVGSDSFTFAAWDGSTDSNLGKVQVTVRGGCTYTLSPTSASFAAAGGSGNVGVTAGLNCAWSANASDTWISIVSGASASGNGTVSYTVAANSSTVPRTGILTVAGQSVTVSQAGLACRYALSSTSASFAAAGGTGSVSVTATGTCPWTSTSNVGWITIRSGANGSGNGSVSYTVARNRNRSSRSGIVTVAGIKLTITQAGSRTAASTFVDTGGR